MKISLILMLCLSLSVSCQEEKSLRQKISDSAPGERWIYDDWDLAKSTAIKSGKPILVVFRCVP